MNYIKLFSPGKTLAMALVILGVSGNSTLGNNSSRLLAASTMPEVSTVTNIYLPRSKLFKSKELLAKLPLNSSKTLVQKPKTHNNKNTSTQSQALAGSYFNTPEPPADRGTPGHREGAASRGHRKLLTALVPAFEGISDDPLSESVLGLTLEERPTFWFYVPKPLTPTTELEFILEDEQGNQLYQSSFTVSKNSSGIVSIKLPSTVKALEVGKIYYWHFKTYLYPNFPTSVDGWVQRVALKSSLQSQLEQATPKQEAAIYAANGIWHEAITSLAKLRRQHPEDKDLSEDWSKLLQDVHLEAIAQEPIVDCCTPLR
ncbi:MAG: DUF928 domain-containing protein [Symploca sp. SIO1C4]|uniref:DUF928 domain-containing protein n=1 Tax=Symploca sp. SIO1C4 TaxID=2607765 RepID=A0A6B3N5X8_9CYAN|nr:DUF928 domain-containing protein [Symploca sp. SIO1C4]